MPKVSRNEKKALKKAAKDAAQKYRQYQEKTAAEAFRDFEEELTFDTFYTLCDIIRHEDVNLQVADTLRCVGYKIPLPELEKILEFIEIEGGDRKWDECEFSVRIILESHHVHNGWVNISKDRLECLLSCLDKDEAQEFWTELCATARLHDPTDIPFEALQTVFNTLLKPNYMDE